MPPIPVRLHARRSVTLTEAPPLDRVAAGRRTPCTVTDDARSHDGGGQGMIFALHVLGTEVFAIEVTARTSSTDEADDKGSTETIAHDRQATEPPRLGFLSPAANYPLDTGNEDT